MNLIVLDTSTLRAVLAIRRSDGAVFAAETDPANRHGRGLLPAIKGLLAEAGLTPGDLTGIAVGLGPGSYTGLRIGVTAAKTLAYATGSALAGLDSLEAIARGAPHGTTRISVIADAQRHELYVADYLRAEPSSPPRAEGPTRFESIERWKGGLTPGTLVLGPGLARLSGPLPDGVRGGDEATHRPGADALLGLALEAFRAGRRDEPWFLEPNYLRRSAAEEQFNRPR